MEDRGSYAIVGGELGDLGVGAFRDDVAGDEAGGVGAVELVEGVNRGFDLGSGHEFVGGLWVFVARLRWVSGYKSGSLA